MLDIPRWNSPLYYFATGLIGELHGPETDVGGPRPFEILAARGVSAGSFTNYLNIRYLGGITFTNIAAVQRAVAVCILIRQRRPI